MKTDKELLELAARACGIECDSVGPFVERKEWVQEFGLNGGFELTRRDWNPLKSDGDALRLAVKLELDIVNINDVNSYVTVWGDGVDDCDEDYGNDPFAATRRAIVRAAAVIGEKL